MIKLRTIIIDDEPLAINVLKNYVSQIQELELIETFSNAIAAATFVQNNHVDIIFLDINMPILDGLDFLKNLQSVPMVVITTAHEEYALTSFELQAIDYLVKPIPFPRFLQATQRIIKLKQSSERSNNSTNKNSSIFIKIDKKKLQKVVLDDILVVESLKDYIRIKTKSDKYIIHKTLSSFTDELPSNNFIRIHRSYTVAISKVDAIEGNSLEIAGIRYTIGRSYINEVKEILLGHQ